MRITIFSVGTQGDVQPYLALALALQEVGHDVTLATGTDFESFATDRHIQYAPLGVDFTALAKSETWIEFHRTNLLGKVKIIKARFGPLVEKVLHDSWPAAQHAEAVIYDQAFPGGRHLAEKLGVPVVICELIPSLLPTRRFPHPTFSFLRLGGYINRLTYSNRSAWYTFFPDMINRWRQEVLQLPPLGPRESDLMLGGQAIPILHAFSPSVIPPPDDWNGRGNVTGYWFLDRLGNWQPPPALSSFLDADSPPVYVGFGSMASLDPRKVTEVVVAALQQVGLRGILATGWGGLTQERVPDSIHILESAPHDWLFERVAAVVHHGGAGTVAAGLRAGKPTVVCPYDLDQPFWGKVVAGLGVGPRPIPQKRLSVPLLSRALLRATTDDEILRRASVLGAKIRGENGVATAVKVIEQLCGARPAAV